MSAVICPQCQAPLVQDFGVVTCQNCGAVLMVDISGDVTLPASDGAASMPQASMPATPAEESPGFVDLTPIDLETPFSGLEAEVPAEEPGAAFRDIQDFGNQDLHSGPLEYTLRIEGLDNGELKRKFQEIVADSRLNLDVPHLMSTLSASSHGKIELASLNPVKVTYIVSRLRHLPLKISWRQSAFHN